MNCLLNQTSQMSSMMMVCHTGHRSKGITAQNRLLKINQLYLNIGQTVTKAKVYIPLMKLKNSMS